MSRIKSNPAFSDASRRARDAILTRGDSLLAERVACRATDDYGSAATNYSNDTKAYGSATRTPALARFPSASAFDAPVSATESVALRSNGANSPRAVASGVFRDANFADSASLGSQHSRYSNCSSNSASSMPGFQTSGQSNNGHHALSQYGPAQFASGSSQHSLGGQNGVGPHVRQDQHIQRQPCQSQAQCSQGQYSDNQGLQSQRQPSRGYPSQGQYIQSQQNQDQHIQSQNVQHSRGHLSQSHQIHSHPMPPKVPPRMDSAIGGAMARSMYTARVAAAGAGHERDNFGDEAAAAAKKSSCPAALHLAHHAGANGYGYVAPRLLPTSGEQIYENQKDFLRRKGEVEIGANLNLNFKNSNPNCLQNPEDERENGGNLNLDFKNSNPNNLQNPDDERENSANLNLDFKNSNPAFLQTDAEGREIGGNSHLNFQNSNRNRFQTLEDDRKSGGNLNLNNSNNSNPNNLQNPENERENGGNSNLNFKNSNLATNPPNPPENFGYDKAIFHQGKDAFLNFAEQFDGSGGGGDKTEMEFLPSGSIPRTTLSRSNFVENLENIVDGFAAGHLLQEQQQQRKREQQQQEQQKQREHNQQHCGQKQQEEHQQEQQKQQEQQQQQREHNRQDCGQKQQREQQQQQQQQEQRQQQHNQQLCGQQHPQVQQQEQQQQQQQKEHIQQHCGQKQQQKQHNQQLCEQQQQHLQGQKQKGSGKNELAEADKIGEENDCENANLHESGELAPIIKADLDNCQNGSADLAGDFGANCHTNCQSANSNNLPNLNLAKNFDENFYISDSNITENSTNIHEHDVIKDENENDICSDGIDIANDISHPLIGCINDNDSNIIENFGRHNDMIDDDNGIKVDNDISHSFSSLNDNDSNIIENSAFGRQHDIIDDENDNGIKVENDISHPFSSLNDNDSNITENSAFGRQHDIIDDENENDICSDGIDAENDISHTQFCSLNDNDGKICDGIGANWRTIVRQGEIGESSGVREVRDTLIDNAILAEEARERESDGKSEANFVVNENNNRSDNNKLKEVNAKKEVNDNKEQQKEQQKVQQQVEEWRITTNTVVFEDNNGKGDNNHFNNNNKGGEVVVIDGENNKDESVGQQQQRQLLEKQQQEGQQHEEEQQMEQQQQGEEQQRQKQQQEQQQEQQRQQLDQQQQQEHRQQVEQQQQQQQQEGQQQQIEQQMEQQPNQQQQEQQQKYLQQQLEQRQQQQEQQMEQQQSDGILAEICNDVTMRADRNTSSFPTSAATAAAAAAAAAAASTAAKMGSDYAQPHIPTHIPPMGSATGAGNRNSTGSTSSGSQASSGFESAKTSNCSVSNLVNSTSSSSCSTAASSAAHQQQQQQQLSHFHVAGRSANTNFGLESPGASSRISTSSSSGGGGGGSASTASRCSTYYGSMEYYDTLGGLNSSGSGGCSTTAGPSCASSGILSDASSTATISPSTSSTSTSGRAPSAAAQNSKSRGAGGGGGGGRVNIKDMMKRGIAEPEILAEWLQRLCLSQYLTQFITQGYDLVSISRITPEDLTALGISRPEDRKRLIQDIQHWSLADGWPTHLPADASVREFLGALGLVQYIELFESQGYTTIHEVEKLTWEDLEDIGVKKLGHMKRICLALKKLKASKNSTNMPHCANMPISPPLSHRDYDSLQYAEHGDNFQSAAVDMSNQAAYATIHRRKPQQQQQFQQQQQYYQNIANPEAQTANPQAQYLSRRSMPFAANGGDRTLSVQGQKQKPTVTVLPNNQAPAQCVADTEPSYDDASCYSNTAKNTVVYKNESFGAENSLADAPKPSKPKKGLKLNLFRTSQILSDFSELPKSLDGEPLNPLNPLNLTRSAAKFTPSAGALDDERNFEGVADEIYSARNAPPPPPPAPLPYASTTSANFTDSSTIRLNHNNAGNGVLRSRRAPPSLALAPDTVDVYAPQNTVQQQQQHTVAGCYATIGSSFAASSQSQPSTPRNLQRFVERNGQKYANMNEFSQERSNTMNLAEVGGGGFGANSAANLRRQFHSDESFGEIDHILRDLSHQVEAIPGPAYQQQQHGRQQQGRQQDRQQDRQQQQQLQARQQDHHYQQQQHQQQQMRRRQQQQFQQQQQEMQRKQQQPQTIVSTKR